MRRLNIIKDYEVVEKIKVELTGAIKEIVKCFNPNCVSNHQVVHHQFEVVCKQPVKLRCPLLREDNDRKGY